MSPDQITLVKRTWGQIAPSGETAATLFYDRLFELDSTLRPLFKGNLELQGRKLVAMLDQVVNSLDNLDGLLPDIRALGQRHGGYGVRPRDYDTVAHALLWTLGAGLGPGFTPAVSEAWRQAYLQLANVMMAAGQLDSEAA
ncbi:globin family protein [Niveibacterium sp. SC-1]|uniref:globin family protein n=1 Tax=Niveibacterium sp. SC-1 TaxID=3135646 RepID=UPI00311F2C44